ncbi:MAG: A/G-specific adenine glycosylase [Clostridia bacterium]|nr:A/G-specific adenine glycosylase [Clostridia bacterium]
MADNEILSQLPERLLPWFAQNKRSVPWRADREPYHVWLSEIMLQQTRVEAVKGYYQRFLQAFPTVRALAQAEDEQLLKLWEGLGYYSRARNLKKAAKLILEQHNGSFPKEYHAVKALPGIGEYTAGAICSICFEQKTPAVDGNVLRVFARMTDCHAAVTDDKVKTYVREALAGIYPENAGDFTQALMELGATVCVPNGAPACELCPISDLCLSKNGGWKNLPVKAPKKTRRVEKKTVFILTNEDRLALVKRPDKGLLAGLWQLPDTEGTLSEQEALDYLESLGVCPQELLKRAEKTHVFTHITWEMTGYYVSCAARQDDFTWVSEAALSEGYSVPTAYRQFL